MILPTELRELEEETTVVGDLDVLEAYIVNGKALVDWFTLRMRCLNMLDDLSSSESLEEWASG